MATAVAEWAERRWLTALISMSVKPATGNRFGARECKRVKKEEATVEGRVKVS
jgi:hypothetical protein